MKCLYCDDFLYHNDWKICKNCDVRFYEGEYEGQYDLHIKWERDVNGACWALNIFPNRNITYLSGYFPEREEMYDEILINHVMTVNKDNVIQKIKTILTFQ